MLTVYKQITIKTLAGQGEKKTTIARQIGCHRNTVYNVLQKGRVVEKQTRNKLSCFDPHKQTIEKYLDQKITRLRIHEILQEEYGVQASYDSLCKYIQKHFPKKPSVFGVQITKPGEEAECDFGYLGMLPSFEGKLVKTWGLAVILSYSRQGYYAICHDQKLVTLTKNLKHAFEYFDGVPKRLKVDNMRTAILKNQHYDLEYNQDFLEFTNHYNTVVVPCTPYHPEQKGKVESGIKYLQSNFISGRVFSDGRDLAIQLRDWMENYANLRTHGTTKKVPWRVWTKEEKKKLQSLPKEDFSFFQRSRRKVARNCHIHFNNSYYSVPGFLVGKEVTVRWTDNLLRIIHKGEQVALHRLFKGQGEYITVRSHLPDYKIYSETEYQARYESKMTEIGEYAHEYFHQLLLSSKGYWNRVVRGILGLSEIYGNTAVNLSLRRALYFKVTDLATIRNILSKRLYEIEVEPRLLIQKRVPAKNSLVQVENSLERDLNYYQVQ